MKADINWMFLGGRVRTLTISNTAGNVVTDLSPGTGKRWIVLRGRIQLSTDATSVNRYVALDIKHGADSMTGWAGSAAVGASVSNAGIGISMANSQGQNGTTRGYGEIVVGFPCIIDGDDKLRISITNGQSGDSYVGWVQVLEVDV